MGNLHGVDRAPALAMRTLTRSSIAAKSECREIAETARRAVSTTQRLPRKSLPGRQEFPSATWLQLCCSVNIRKIRVNPCPVPDCASTDSLPYLQNGVLGKRA